MGYKKLSNTLENVLDTKIASSCSGACSKDITRNDETIIQIEDTGWHNTRLESGGENLPIHVISEDEFDSSSSSSLLTSSEEDDLEKGYKEICLNMDSVRDSTSSKGEVISVLFLRPQNSLEP